MLRRSVRRPGFRRQSPTAVTWRCRALVRGSNLRERELATSLVLIKLRPPWPDDAPPGERSADSCTIRGSSREAPLNLLLMVRRSSVTLQGCGSGPGTEAEKHLASHPWQIFYTEGVEAHWRETTVGEHGELVLEGLPFDPGQAVEVLVVSKASGSTGAGALSLQGSVLEFREPLEPVASEDWDALQ